MERWMKEKASKSLGGASMSKFVEESERKRIMRLKNMKSAIAKSSYTRHENPWTRNNVEKRHKEIKRDIMRSKKSKEADAADFQLDNLCDESDVRTRSGLKLKKQSTVRRPKEPKSRPRDPRLVALKKARDDKGAFNSMRDAAEGKENCSPSNDATVPKQSLRRQVVVTNKTNMESQRKKIIDRSDTRKKITKKSPENHQQQGKKMGRVVGPSRISDNGKKITASKATMKRRDGKEKNHKTTGEEPSKDNPSKPWRVRNTGTSKPDVRRKSKGKKYSPYDNRGVSLDTLSKERKEAMQILQGLEKSDFSSKLSAMKSSIDGLSKNASEKGRIGTKIQVEDFDNLSLSSYQKVNTPIPPASNSPPSSGDVDTNDLFENSLDSGSGSSYIDGANTPPEAAQLEPCDNNFEYERLVSKQESFSCSSDEEIAHPCAMDNASNANMHNEFKIDNAGDGIKQHDRAMSSLSQWGEEQSDSDAYSETFDSDASSFTIAEGSKEGTEHSFNDSRNDNLYTKATVTDDETSCRESDGSAVSTLNHTNIHFDDGKNEVGDIIFPFSVESFFEDMT